MISLVEKIARRMAECSVTHMGEPPPWQPFLPMAHRAMDVVREDEREDPVSSPVARVFMDLIHKHHDLAVKRDEASRKKISDLIVAIEEAFPSEIGALRNLYGINKTTEGTP